MAESRDERLVRRRVVVHGMVQGVLFRDTCRNRAISTGVTGWVRNTAEGDVEAVFEGTRAAVDALCAWCRGGPRRARVEYADVHEEEPAGQVGFEVRG